MDIEADGQPHADMPSPSDRRAAGGTSGALGRDTARMIDNVSTSLALLTAVWLLVAPFGVALDFVLHERATLSTLAMGTMALMGAVAALMRTGAGLLAAALLTLGGMWGIIAPFAIGFEGPVDSDATANSMMSGIALIALAVAGFGARTSLERTDAAEQEHAKRTTERT